MSEDILNRLRIKDFTIFVGDGGKDLLGVNDVCGAKQYMGKRTIWVY